MTDEINVAFGFDEHYAVHVAAVVASIARHSRHRRFRYIMLHTGVPPEMQARIEQLAPNGRFVWVSVKDDDLPAFESRLYLTRSTLFRLGLEKLAPPDCDRIIYLDGDLAVIGDLAPLWNYDLGGHAIGAVIDGGIDHEGFAQRWQLAGQGRYFNAGVLLIDMKKVRQARLFSPVIEFLAKHDRELPFNDQDALNWFFWNNWCRLPVAWNVQTGQAVPETRYSISQERRLGDDEKPVIIHYTGPGKPWMPDVYHPWAWAYWMGLARTPFLGQVAEQYGVGTKVRFRLWLRWLKRHPAGPRTMLGRAIACVSPRRPPDGLAAGDAGGAAR